MEHSVGMERWNQTRKTMIENIAYSKLILDMTFVDKWKLMLDIESGERLLLLFPFDRTHCSGMGVWSSIFANSLALWQGKQKAV